MHAHTPWEDNLRQAKLTKLFFYHKFGVEGEHKATEEDLKSASETPQPAGSVVGVFTEVPSDRSDIDDFNNMTTNKQFWFTKVHAVFEGGHTLDVWAGLNSQGDKCWLGYNDWCDLDEMLGEYAFELPRVPND